MTTKTQESENEIKETLDLANKVVSLYEELISTHSLRIQRLEAENAVMAGFLKEAEGLLRATLQMPKRSLIN